MVKIQNATVALPMIILKHGKRDKQFRTNEAPKQKQNNVMNVIIKV